MKARLTQIRKEILSNKKQLAFSILFLMTSCVFYLISGYKVKNVESSPLPDLILNNIPSVNLGILYVWGFLLILAVLIIYPLFYKVKDLHYVIGQFSLVVLIRSFFISLTHLRSPADAIVPEMPRLFALLNFPNALFFSGHTAIPFLGFLLYRKEKIGIFFFVMTILTGE